MDYWQPFLVVNLCHSLIEYYTISNGKWIWLLRYMTKIHQNERKKKSICSPHASSPQCHLQCYPASMYALGFAGMTMSMPSLPQYGDNFEHANQVVLMRDAM